MTPRPMKATLREAVGVYIFALVLAWGLLGQAIAPMQLVGAAVVVSTVMWLGLRKPKP